MNILVVHETEYRDKFIFEYQIVPEILASRGHSVFVIDYPTYWKKDSPFDFGTLSTTRIPNVSKAAKKKGVTLIRPGLIKIPLLSRLSAFFTNFFVIRSIILTHHIDHIILMAAPTNGLQTIFWAKWFKIPVLFRLFDVLHQLVPHPTLQLPTYLVEKVVYRQANKILAITPRLTRYAIRISGNHAAEYLPSGSDADLFYPGKQNQKLMKEYGISPNDFVLVFAGTLYVFSGLEEVIRGMPQQLKRFPHLKLLIVGKGLHEPRLRQVVSELHLEKQVIFTGFIQYEKLADYLRLGHVGLSTFTVNPVTDRIFPGKIYQYAGCGLPTISSKLPGVMDLFPPTQTDHGIYYYERMEEFWKLVQRFQTKKIKVTDVHPSLQTIAAQIETELERL